MADVSKALLRSINTEHHSYSHYVNSNKSSKLTWSACEARLFQMLFSIMLEKA